MTGGLPIGLAAVDATYVVVFCLEVVKKGFPHEVGASEYEDVGPDLRDHLIEAINKILYKIPRLIMHI